MARFAVTPGMRWLERYTANALGSETYRLLESYTLVGIIFLAISLPAAARLRVFEAWTKHRLGMTK